MTKLSDIQKRCLHGNFHAHCDEHPGKGSHFGAVAHDGGCRGPEFVIVADLVAALQEEGVLVAETSWCEFHRSQRGQGLKNECWRGQKARDVGYDDHEDCRMVPVLVVRIEGETDGR